MRKNVILPITLLVMPLAALAQSQPASSETGAISVNIASGWSFGLPANRAVVSVPGIGTAISPEKRVLTAPSAGIGITAWKNVVAFFDLAAYDAGTATASAGAYKSSIEGDILTLNGGVRILASQSKVRPYAEFGGGILYQKPKITFSTPSGSSVNQDAASVGNFMYGVGVQTFVGRRWGVDIGFDGYHVTQELAQGGSNFSRIRIGLFFQTKSKLP